MSVRPFVHRKFLRFQWNLVCKSPCLFVFSHIRIAHEGEVCYPRLPCYYCHYHYNNNNSSSSSNYYNYYYYYSLRHQSTLFCSNFVKFGRREIGEIVRYLRDKKFVCLSNCRYCANPNRAQNLPGPVPSPQQCTPSAPDFIQIGSLSVEL